MNEQRKILLPENMPPSPPEEPEPIKEEEDSKMDIDESHISKVDANETDEEPTGRKSRRRWKILLSSHFFCHFFSIS